MYLTGAWNDDLIVTIVAYREGAAVSTTTHTLSATAPTLVTLNLSQIDRVNMSAAGGTSHGYPTGGGVGWVHFAMDNLDISFNLPPTGVTATAGNAQATVAFTPPRPMRQTRSRATRPAAPRRAAAPPSAPMAPAAPSWFPA
ncbi:hypothetical protein H0I39_15465 [Ottowia beijingensis]|uniref:Uncharacterized protein n=1 Tax=Ottowia beijingensis TaxID=1207057 RepID=A0A853IYI5_9BURK|nr:hypothetical protein [Ottowia beijingensis]NZA02788.1 hypothetical protein [Ottowia beijingensis]